MTQYLLFLPICLLYILPFFFPTFTKPIFVYSSYYFMMFIFLWWLYSGVQYFISKNYDVVQRSNLKKSLFIALTSTILCFISVEICFKVNSDETNLLSISRTLYFNKMAYNGTMGKFFFDNLNIFNYEVPKRPLFFPFITSLFHNFIGYSKYAPFIVNFLSLFGIFFLMISNLRMSSIREKISLSCLILSFPIFAIYGTSAGFDILSIFFLLLCLKLLWEIFNRQNKPGWSFFIPSILIYAHIRYESILFSALMLLFLLVTRSYNLKYFFTNSSMKLFLIGYFPQILQRILSVGKYENPSDRSVLSLISIKEHGLLMLNKLVELDTILPYNAIINLLTPLLIVVSILYITRSNGWSKKENKFFIFFIFFALINTLLFLSHHAGLYDHPTQARFFFIYALLGLSLIIYFYHLCKHHNKENILFFFSLFMFFFYFPKAVEGRFMNKLVINRDLSFIYSFIDKQMEKNNLYVYDRPGQIVALNLGAVNSSYARENWIQLKSNLKSGLFANIYVISKERYGEKENFLMEKDLLPVKIYQSSSSKRLIIYKLKHN